MQLILASKSPRRSQILKDFGYQFNTVTASFKEVCFDNMPQETAKKNALGKATATFNTLSDKENSVVLGSDTVVCLDGKILGKPKDNADAINMLKSLSGKTHQVVTGYAVITSGKKIVGCSISDVTFNDLSPELIIKYVESGSPLDKAGAYGIQDDFPLVKSYTGELNNVIGLPIESVKKILDKIL